MIGARCLARQPIEERLIRVGQLEQLEMRRDPEEPAEEGEPKVKTAVMPPLKAERRAICAALAGSSVPATRRKQIPTTPPVTATATPAQRKVAIRSAFQRTNEPVMPIAKASAVYSSEPFAAPKSPKIKALTMATTVANWRLSSTTVSIAPAAIGKA